MFNLTELGTIAGVAGFLKLVAIPAAKTIWPGMQGRATVLFAYSAGVVAAVAASAAAGKTSAGELGAAALTGIAGAASAIGANAAVNAVRRPEKV
ncbi:MAG: hypothetical protein WC683_04510 [bacterium]